MMDKVVLKAEDIPDDRVLGRRTAGPSRLVQNRACAAAGSP